ncbi:hypothetical protein BC833DRAFT_578422 [Globomyces pollinis-pini]|nr:hypothetical protein BC833DRAFT_578422 [Globomyces pollinis-pini]
MKCKIVAKVLYDYDAQTDEELSIKEGQIVIITDDTDRDWWMAYEKPRDTFEEGRTGLVPLTYVEEATPLSTANALYDYDPQTDEEIAMREGDLVRVYEQLDEDWWYVKIDHDVGLVPASYVEQSQTTVESHTVAPNTVGAPAVDAEDQKNKLLDALGGFGFDKRKSEVKAPTGVIYGPDDITYFNMLEIDKKKKKNSVKGLIGVSGPDKKIYFLHETTKEIISATPLSTLKKKKEKKTILKLEYDSEIKEYEGDKADVIALSAQIDTAISFKPPPTNIQSPIQPTPIQSHTPTPMPIKPPQNNQENSPAIALYDYAPVESEELEIRENDELIVLDTSDPDWWLVKHARKQGEGLVPSTYVELKSSGTANNNAAQEAHQRELDREAEERQRIEEEQRREMKRRESEARERQMALARQKQEEETRQREKERQQQMPKIPERPKMETPGIPSRGSPVQPTIPTIPSRPQVAQTGPAIPGRPSVHDRPTPISAPKPSIPEKPVIPDRPVAPTSRPQTETQPEKKQNLPNPKNVRDWSDKSGKFKVQAEFVGITENKVQLHKTNGVTIGVPFDKLDDNALDYLKTLPENRGIDFGTKLNVPAPPPMNARRTSSANQLAGSNSDAFTYNGFDWKEWLIKAGIATFDAETYGRKFAEQKLDSSILTDIDRDALRAMQITEGDIIRIRKAANLPQISNSARAKTAQNEALAQAKNLEMLSLRSKNTKQLQDDEALARQLQNEENMRASGNRNPSHVNPSALFEAGNLLNAASKTSPPLSKRTNGNNGSFSMPPSTQQVGTSSGLGLKAPSSSALNNDPWGSFSGSATTPNNDAIMKTKLQQEETQKALETARLAIQKANEQAKQAAMLQEQNQAAKLQQQSEMAYQKAQETAKQALLIQQQASQKLLDAQRAATQPQVTQLQPSVQFQPNAAFQQMPAMVPKPLPPALIPTPTGQLNSNFIPTRNSTSVPMAMQPNNMMQNSNMMQNNMMQSNMMQGNNMMQPVIQSNVTSSGVAKPNWTQATPSQPFGNNAQRDPYAAFKESTPNAPSIFSSTPGSLQAQLTGASGGSGNMQQPNFNQSNVNMMSNNGFMSNQNTGMSMSQQNTGMNMNQQRPNFTNQPNNVGMNMMQNNPRPMQNNMMGMGNNTSMPNQNMMGMGLNQNTMGMNQSMGMNQGNNMGMNQNNMMGMNQNNMMGMNQNNMMGMNQNNMMGMNQNAMGMNQNAMGMNQNNMMQPGMVRPPLGQQNFQQSGFPNQFQNNQGYRQ